MTLQLEVLWLGHRIPGWYGTGCYLDPERLEF
jgi:hypothetical protein